MDGVSELAPNTWRLCLGGRRLRNTSFNIHVLRMDPDPRLVLFVHQSFRFRALWHSIPRLSATRVEPQGQEHAKAAQPCLRPERRARQLWKLQLST